MNKRQGTAIMSSVLGGAAILVGAFYYLMGQVQKVSDKADANTAQIASVNLSVSNRLTHLEDQVDWIQNTIARHYGETIPTSTLSSFK